MFFFFFLFFLKRIVMLAVVFDFIASADFCLYETAWCFK